VIILGATTYDGTAATVLGEPFKGDGYYGRADGLHTVAYHLNQFAGTVKIQGTLIADPGENDWFDIDDTGARDGSTVLTENLFRNFTGNFMWIRVVVSDFSAGTVNKVLYIN